MTLYKMVKEIITTKLAGTKCSECGQTFEYPEDSLYKPSTCGSFDCVFAYLHPKLKGGRNR